MKNTKQIIESIRRQGIVSKPEEQPVINDFAKGIIDKVFNQLEVIFPAWKQAWTDESKKASAKMEWTKAFIENDISTIEQIQYGFKKARQADTDFLPSCGKFVSWCCPSPEDMGYPSEERAKQLCVSYRANKKLGVKMYVRPLIIELVKRIDWWVIDTAGSNEEHKRANKHFKDVYLDLIENYVEPKEIDSPRLESEEKVNSRMNESQRIVKSERGMDYINKIRKKLKQSIGDK